MVKIRRIDWRTSRWPANNPNTNTDISVDKRKNLTITQKIYKKKRQIKINEKIQKLKQDKKNHTLSIKSPPTVLTFIKTETKHRIIETVTHRYIKI